MSTTDVHEMSAGAIASEIFDLLGYRVVKYWLADVITPRWAYKVVTPEGVCHWMTAHQNAENAKREVCKTWISDIGAAFELCRDVLDRLNESALGYWEFEMGALYVYFHQYHESGAKIWHEHACGRDARALSELALLALREIGEDDE